MALTKVSPKGTTTISAGFDAVNTIIDDLASTGAGKGASCVGVRDSGGYYTEATVEAVLAEIGSDWAGTRSFAEAFNEDSSTTTGLTWGWKAGTFRIDDTVYEIAAGTISLTDDATNYIEIDPATQTLGRNTTSWTTGKTPVRLVVCASGAQTTSTDYRAWMYRRTSPLVVVQGGTGAATLTDGGILLGSGTGAVTASARPTEAQVLIGQATGDPLPKSVSGVIAIAATGATVFGGAGDVVVADGGTGVSTLTDHGVMLGSGTDPVTVTTAMTAGQLLVGQTGADPLPKTISGAITVAASGAMALADSAITQAKLSTATGAVSSSSDLSFSTLPGGTYGFYPQVYNTNASSAAWAVGIRLDTVNNGGPASYTTLITLKAYGGTTYAQQRYVTSSGPLHWIFLLKRKDTGQVISAYEAPDHPCYGNGGSPLLVQHPFPDVTENRWMNVDGIKTEIEIIVINPTDYQVQLAEAMGAPVIVGKDIGYMTEDLYLTAAAKLTDSGQSHLMSDLEAMAFYQTILKRPVSQEEARDILMANQGCVLDISRSRKGRLQIFQEQFEVNNAKPWTTTPITVDLPGNGIHNTQVIDWRLHIGELIEPIKIVVPQPQDINRFAMAVKK